MLMPKEDNNILEYFGLFKDEKYKLDEQDIEKYYRDLIGKSWNIWSFAKDTLSKHISQDDILASKLSLFLREVKFGKQEFPANKPVLDIKY